MSVGIIVQARMGSARLPGKSIRLLADRPLLYHVLFRLKICQRVKTIILASSVKEEDAVLGYIARELHIPFFRGSECNVRQRFRAAIKCFGLTTVIRVTGDNPLIEPALVDELIRAYQMRDLDYAGFKECAVGIGSEVFSAEAFERACAYSDSPYDREHVTPPFYRLSDRFRVSFLLPDKLFRRPEVRLTVDSFDDLARMRKLYGRFYDGKSVCLRRLFGELFCSASVLPHETLTQRGCE